MLDAGYWMLDAGFLIMDDWRLVARKLATPNSDT